MPPRPPSMAVPVTCEKCSTTFKVASPLDVDASLKELEGAGWMHFAKKGKGRERWTWKCPACKPDGSPTTRGPSAGWR